MIKRLFNKIVLIVFALLISEVGLGQHFSNASFEGPAPSPNQSPPGWALCDGTPDTQPYVWDVPTQPSEGVSYVGMCWFGSYVEMISTQLNEPFYADSCYNFEIDLAFYHEINYYGQIQDNYPIIIQIYGSDYLCTTSTLLWTSPYIDNTSWITYSFKIEPEEDITGISIRTYSEEPPLPYPENIGYILMDNIQITSPPPLELGPDTTICNDTLVLCPGSGFDSYVWQDGSTDSCYTVTNPGIYWVEAYTDYECMVSDTIVIDGGLIVNLGNDTTIAFCPGDSLVLYAGSGFSNYLWSTGDEDSLIVVYTSGTYWVQIMDDEGCIGSDTIVVDITPYEQMNILLIDSTMICEGQELTIYIDVELGNSPYELLWLDSGDTSNSITVIPETTTTYVVQVTDDCDVVILDSVKVVVQPVSEVDIGENQIICYSDTLLLSGGSGMAEYQWQDGSTDSVYLVTGPGWYWVNVTSVFGCVGNDSVYIDFYPPVNINLGSDTLLCESGSLILDAGPGFDSYLWYNNTTSQTVTVNTTGVFWVTVMDQNACIGADTIQVGLSPAVTIDLGGDTTICSSDDYFLSPGSGFTQYLWQNGSTESYIEVSTPGTYWVQVVDVNACTGSDTVHIGINPSPEINLGVDTTICQGEYLTLDVGNSYASYLWHDNSTSSTFYVYESGNYSVTVTNYYNCQASDEIFVEVASPEINLGPDSSICFHDSIYLQPGENFTYYEWQDGSNGSTYHVTKSGIYSVSVMDEFGCADEDNVELVLVWPPTVDLGDDQLMCSGNTITLEAPVGPYAYYWNGIEGTATYEVSAGGECTVRLLNMCGDANDSIYIEEIETPQVDLGPDILLNPGENIELDAGPGFDSYLWQDGSVNQFFRISPDNIDSQNPYCFVEVTTGPCKGSDTIDVFFFIVELPLVFTPNNDGKNDLFLPMKRSWNGITSHRINIFNRWGEKVWESENFEDGWDGKQNGKLVADGTYFWVLEVYYGPDNARQTQKGTVSVLGTGN